jgi:hypothetical protein
MEYFFKIATVQIQYFLLEIIPNYVSHLENQDLIKQNRKLYLIFLTSDF